MNTDQLSRRRARAIAAVQELNSGVHRTRRQLFPKIDHTATDGVSWETKFLEELEHQGFIKKAHKGTWVLRGTRFTVDRALENMLATAQRAVEVDFAAGLGDFEDDDETEPEKASTDVPPPAAAPDAFQDMLLANVSFMRETGLRTQETAARIQTAAESIFEGLGAMQELRDLLGQIVELMREQRDLLGDLVELGKEQTERLEAIADERRNRSNTVSGGPKSEPAPDRGRYSRLGRG